MTKKFLYLLPTLLTASTVWAQDAGAPAAAQNPDPIKGLLLNLPIFLALFLLFYFGLINPQKKQAAKQAEFLSKLNRGDEVVTASGIIGTIRGLTDKVVTLEIAQGTEIKILRSQVQGALKDTVTT